MKIYIAGGWFNDNQKEKLVELEEFMISEFPEFTYFMPRRHNIGLLGCNWDRVFEVNLDEIKNCDIIIASTVDKDMGTIWECGYGYAKGKTIIYYTPGIDKPNLMLGKSGAICKTLSEVADYLYVGKAESLNDFE